MSSQTLSPADLKRLRRQALRKAACLGAERLRQNPGIMSEAREISAFFARHKNPSREALRWLEVAREGDANALAALAEAGTEEGEQLRDLCPLLWPPFVSDAEFAELAGNTMRPMCLPRDVLEAKGRERDAIYSVAGRLAARRLKANPGLVEEARRIIQSTESYDKDGLLEYIESTSLEKKIADLVDSGEEAAERRRNGYTMIRTPLVSREDLLALMAKEIAVDAAVSPPPARNREAWREYHATIGRLAAGALRARPELLEKGKEILDLWRGLPGFTVIHNRWAELLETASAEEVASVLEADGPENDKLRAASPFSFPPCVSLEDREKADAAFLERTKPIG